VGERTVVEYYGLETVSRWTSKKQELPLSFRLGVRRILRDLTLLAELAVTLPKQGFVILI